MVSGRRKLAGNEEVVLGWGDEIDVGATKGGVTQVRLQDADGTWKAGTVKGKPAVQETGVLKLALVDVQQGDGIVLEAPGGEVMLVDGGENQLFARYLAARFRRPEKANPLPVEAIVVTHGDADHCTGINHIRKSEAYDDTKAYKRLFIAPKRFFHNGLVKGPAKGRSATEVFGETRDKGGRTYAVQLVDDLLDGDLPPVNKHFKALRATLRAWKNRAPGGLRCLRAEAGGDAAFDFMGDNVNVEVLGPVTETVSGRPGLPFLHAPSRTDPGAMSESYSASHTINGHSIALRIVCGNVRLLLAGDLNKEGLRRLLKRFGPEALAAEVVKVPHHGSADVDLEALRHMNALCWLISSGDESSAKEYIHPRASLVGALGMATSRPFPPLVLCTELAAFFAVRGYSRPAAGGKTYFGFERTSFGIVHVRTDGERLLVFTHSGKKGLKEAYRYRVGADHAAKPEKVRQR